MAITDIKDVNTWEDYEEYVRNTDPEAWKIHEKSHKFAEAMSIIMDDLQDFGQTIEIHDHTSTLYDDEPPKYLRFRKNFKYNSAAKSRKTRARLLRLQRA